MHKKKKIIVKDLKNFFSAETLFLDLANGNNALKTFEEELLQEYKIKLNTHLF